MCVQEEVVLLGLLCTQATEDLSVYRDREGGEAWGALATPILSGKKYKLTKK